ncbi:MAG: hypothetical protein KME59_10805 [Trichormus sp. ATA11-4-KO1]|jgi:hypothetical protein|nr:hypothetical protein [Trichormus sp. ATA11-4-KO1]
MGRRFNNLDAALKYLRAPGATADDLAPDAPAGSQLKKYQDFKAGKVNIDYPRAASSLPGSLDDVALKPFALPSADTTEYIVGVSTRSKGNLGTVGLSLTTLNLSDTLTNAARVIGFTPARAVVSDITGTTASTKTSKLTGRPYKSKTTVTYTFPFGSKATNGTYSEVKADIIAGVDASAGTKSVSFKPEIFR